MKKQLRLSGFCDGCGRWKPSLKIARGSVASGVAICRDCLASAGAPARAYDATGVETISAGGEPLKDQSPDGGQLVPVKEAMGKKKGRKGKRK